MFISVTENEHHEMLLTHLIKTIAMQCNVT